MRVYLIFVSVFFAGIASLQMELSLLREASFELGSTAKTNSLIISTFLAGLAFGAYLGNFLVRRCNGRARLIFAVSQMVNIACIVAFVLIKPTILYEDHSYAVTLTFFLTATLVPACVAGMSFSLYLNMLYEYGEKYIAGVYAVSTMGNVLSGFMHGLVLVPNPMFGMRSTYFLAVVGSAIAILLIADFRKTARLVTAVVALGCCYGVMAAPRIPESIREHYLFSKDDLYGLVEVANSTKEHYQDPDKQAVDLRIHNKHNCATTKHSVDWTRDSVNMASQLLENKAERVLNMGYCSGQSTFFMLKKPNIKEVISVDLNGTVIEAAQQYFPEFHEPNMEDDRFTLVLDEFRSYMKRLPADEKFDIIMIDVTVTDPYYYGLFTREFFDECQQHLTERGVIFWHYKRHLLRTGTSVFEFLYQHRASTRPFYFFTNFKISKKLNGIYRRLQPHFEADLVYTDHRMYELEAGERMPPLEAR